MSQASRSVDIPNLGFKKSPNHFALLQNTASIAGVDPRNYDAVFFAGGQSPMVTFRRNEKLQRFVAAFYEDGKVTALVCHATCLLLELRLSNGELPVKGKTWTGFATSEEKLADSFVGKRIQPFWIEDEARKIEGTNFVVGGGEKLVHFGALGGSISQVELCSGLLM